MAKPAHLPITNTKAKDSPPASEALTQRVTAEGKPMTVVTIGNVTVTVPTPTAEELKKALLDSQRASRALVDAIPWRGLRLNLPAIVPLYEADSKDPNLVIKKLGKTRTLGTFDEHGRFVKVKR